jgi:glycosyltransferase involved in cell wall biosynthesis
MTRLRIGACITTRHRPDMLRDALAHLAKGSLRPDSIVVSDDSSEPDLAARTREAVAEFPNVTYVSGPRQGVCANRNHALDQLGDVDLVTFLDDDAMVSPEYLATAVAFYDGLPADRRGRVILSGVRNQLDGGRTRPTRINFRGFFEDADPTEVAGASYAVYPRQFLAAHRWDELIYFGYEDAELSLRARRDGFTIVHRDDLVLTDAGKRRSTLLSEGERVNQYLFLGSAARLYVGVKRYGVIDRNLGRLALFVVLFFVETLATLAKRRSLRRLPELVRVSNVDELLPLIFQRS